MASCNPGVQSMRTHSTVPGLPDGTGFRPVSSQELGLDKGYAGKYLKLRASWFGWSLRREWLGRDRCSPLGKLGKTWYTVRSPAETGGLYRSRNQARESRLKDGAVSGERKRTSQRERWSRWSGSREDWGCRVMPSGPSKKGQRSL